MGRCINLITDIKFVCRQGNANNEDFVGFSGNYIFAVDGSSSLNKSNLMENNADAMWFSHSFGEHLKPHLNDFTLSLGDAVYKALSEIKLEFEELIKKSSIADYIYPSASICLFRLNGSRLEYFQLGDCTAIIKHKSHELTILHDDTVSKLDKAVVSQMVKISREQNISVKAAAPQIKQMLIDNRKKKNTEGGYWILDISRDGIAHAFTANFDAKEIDSIAVMSDGFADACTTYAMFDDFSKLYYAMETENLDDIADSLFLHSANDSDFNKYPRLKLRDDSSAVWGRIKP